MASLRFSKATLIKVLVFGVVSVIFTVGLGLKIGNLRLFSDEYKLEAVFGDATGIFKGDAVKLAGVDVGRVLGAKIERGKGIVEFTVSKEVKLPRDSVVGLRWRNVLGQRFLYLYPGAGTQLVSFHGPAQIRQQTGYFQDGDRIPEEQTIDAGDLNEFLNTLGPILRAIDPDKANAFLDAMNTALGGNEVVVRQLLNSGGVLASRLGAMDEQIKTFISASDTVIHTYAEQNEAISAILEDLDVLGGSLQGMIGDIDSLIVNLADVQRLLDQLLKRNRGHIDATLRSLNSVLNVLVRNRTALEHTLCTLPAGISPYMQTTSWGEWFNVRITTVVFKDENGNTIQIVPEKREGTAQPPYALCSRLGLPSGGGGGGGGGGGDDDDDGPDDNAANKAALGTGPGSLGAFISSTMRGFGA